MSEANEGYIFALEDALEALLDFALTVAPSSDYWEDTWDEKEKILDEYRKKVPTPDRPSDGSAP